MKADSEGFLYPEAELLQKPDFLYPSLCFFVVKQMAVLISLCGLHQPCIFITLNGPSGYFQHTAYFT